MNKFKNFLLLSAALVAAFSFTVDKIVPNSKLAAAFTAKQLAEKTDAQIDFMNYVSTKGYIIHQESKSEEFPLLSTVLKAEFISSFDFNNLSNDNFNPYMLTVSPGESHSFYLVDGTSKTVQLYSESFIQKRFGQIKTNEKNALNRKK
ncbi:MAG: hypothetical protein ACKVOK_07785 [Flavobacteriales bacterium]